MEMKAVCSALDGHDPGGVRCGRLNATGDKKPALRHAAMFCTACVGHMPSADALSRRDAITVPVSGLNNRREEAD